MEVCEYSAANDPFNSKEQYEQALTACSKPILSITADEIKLLMQLSDCVPALRNLESLIKDYKDALQDELSQQPPASLDMDSGKPFKGFMQRMIANFVKLTDDSKSLNLHYVILDVLIDSSVYCHKKMAQLEQSAA